MADGSLEVWFRGEGIGVDPSRPGADLHDFGDGLYFTDREDVAKVYAAKRAASADEQLIWMVGVERGSLGRVLDLSIDARWNDFITRTTDPITVGRSRQDLIKAQPNSFGGFFEEFLKENNLSLKNYDAVIGPEFNLGGRQLCILHKNGQPSTIALRMRTLLKPANWVARWLVNKSSGKELVRINLLPKSSPRFGFLKGAAGFLAGAGLFALFAYLAGKLTGYFHEKIINDDLKKLEPEIQKRLEAKKHRALELIADGKKAYATVRVEIIYDMQFERSPETHGYNNPVPRVELGYVGIGFINAEGPGEIEKVGDRYDWTEKHNYILTSEITFPQEDIESFKAAKAELQWYDDRLKSVILTEDERTRLANEKKILENKMAEFFGR